MDPKHAKILSLVAEVMAEELRKCRRKGMSAKDTKDTVTAAGIMVLGLSELGFRMGVTKVTKAVDYFYKARLSPTKTKTSRRK